MTRPSSACSSAALRAARELSAGGLRVRPAAILRWHRQAGWSPGAQVDLALAGSERARLTLQHGGRGARPARPFVLTPSGTTFVAPFGTSERYGIW